MAFVFDNSASNAGATTNSVSYSLNVGTGANRLLVFGAMIFDLTLGNRVITSVTYNGVNLTKVRSDDNATNSGRTEIWYLINPSSGNNTLTATATGVVAKFDSFVGAWAAGQPFSQPNTSNGNTATTGTTETVALTTTANDCLLVDAIEGFPGPFTPDATQTSLADLSTSRSRGSYKIISGAAGAQNMTFTSLNSGYEHTAAAFTPYMTASTFPMMGV